VWKGEILPTEGGVWVGGMSFPQYFFRSLFTVYFVMDIPEYKILVLVTNNWR